MSKPTFSVVVCVYNGAQNLADTLQSLMDVHYPADKYEIVVVDDGSTDGSAEIARSFKRVRLVSHGSNQGHSAARNTGYREAKGTYVAYIDDDCIASPQWLMGLETALKRPGAIGAGGYIAPASQKYLTERYLTCSGYGRPASVQVGEARSLWQRLKAYVTDKFSAAGTHQQLADGPVAEVYGANAAFPRKKLQAVDGFPTNIKSSEDAAICQRLRQKFPEGSIQFSAQATVSHVFDQTFGTFLHTLFGRQVDTLALYRLTNRLPPFFPFPVGILLVAAVTAWFSWPLALAVLVLLPLLAYAWWPLAALKYKKPEYVLYAYMQAIEETIRDAGLLAAGLERFNRPYPHVLAAVAVLGAALAGVHGARLSWLELPTALLLVAVPGYVLIQALGLRRMFGSPFKKLAFMMVLGVLWNMVIGLVAATLLPRLGIDRPLENQTLLPVYGIGMAVIALVAVVRRRVPMPVHRFRPTNRAVFLWVITIALPFCSVIGASLLDRGQGNLVTVFTLSAAALLLVVAAWQHRHLPHSLLPAVLFSVSLAALFSYTLRSSFLFGWDIQQEFKMFLQTQTTATWTIGQVHNPYDAMLSLTILPTVISNVANVSGLMVFKVLFPLLFSFVPVLLYYVYRLWAKRWLAFTAAAIFIAQFYYFQEFAALARQQIAFLFFAALLYVLMQRRAGGHRRVVLAVLMIAGLVVSHYSTTYMSIALLGGAFVLAKLFYLVRRRQWIPRSARLIPLWAVGALLLIAVGWYGPTTHSSVALSKFDGGPLSTKLLQDVRDAFEDKGQEPASTNGTYLQQIGAQYRKDEPYLNYYADARNNTVKTVAEQRLPDRWPFARQASELLDAALRSLWWIAGAIGIAWFIWRAWKHFGYRNSEVAALTVMALAAFTAIHLVPSVGQYYNIPRLNQQSLMFAALPATAALFWLARKLLPRISQAVVLAPVIAAFLIASGLLSQTVGGKAHANLNNYGTDYQHFYIHQSEVAAARWLEQDRGRQSTVIYADRYSNLRLIVPTTINGHVVADITPETLAKYAYVYAGQTNTVGGVTMASYKGAVVITQFPEQFITSHKSTLYTNGYSGVYK